MELLTQVLCGFAFLVSGAVIAYFKFPEDHSSYFSVVGFLISVVTLIVAATYEYNIRELKIKNEKNDR